MQGKLQQLRDAIKQRWEELTDKDLDAVEGKLDQLSGLQQARYGCAKAQADKRTS
jgi:uncharacterized protein YjbJ (UPF0337 family)